MEKVFGTTDVLEVASQILLKGHVQLTAEQRRQMQEDKRKQVIAKIAREGINPQNGLPHPAMRIENAMNEAKVKVDALDCQAQRQVKPILQFAHLEKL